MNKRSLTTVVPDVLLSRFIDYREHVVLIGSCFTENIGFRLKNAGFDAFTNPTGIIFNPISVARTIDHICQNTQIDKAALEVREDLFFHWDFHSSFSGLEVDQVLSGMNDSFTRANEKLRSLGTLVITLGSAWVYQLKDSSEVVANCHKIAQNRFIKRLLSKQEIVESLTKAFSQLQELNTNVRVILTLSPVRHWKDGAMENSISKSTLRLAISELVKLNAVDYFPAYEVMMDELRDYRFYDDDLVHPNQLAQDIIWTRFMRAAFDEATLECIGAVEKYRKMQAHRSLHPGSVEDIRFKEHLELERIALNERFPFLHLH